MTSLVAGFVCKLHTFLSNAVFLKQLAQIGFLAHFESLLSTNGSFLFNSRIFVFIPLVFLTQTLRDISNMAGKVAFVKSRPVTGK